MSEIKNSSAISATKPSKAPKGFFRFIRKTYALLSSVKLALALLIAILASCLAGVTILRGDRAWPLIFNALWFNGLLVLLVVNVAFCFFGRIWGRRVTLVSFGMILFHLSFVAMFAGIVYNSLFYFRGMIRLTEGEVLSNRAPESYDSIDRGRFFDMAKLKGEITLIRMHANYDVLGANKWAAYEIAVGERRNTKRDIIYTTKKLEYNGFQYVNDREGYSLLIVLYDNAGRELYGAHVPLQSYKQKDETYVYTTGARNNPEGMPFPQDPLNPAFVLQPVFHPSLLKGNERQGEVSFQAWTLEDARAGFDRKPFAQGKARVGEMVGIGDYFVSVKEVRYWAAMSVRYEPGKPIVLASLWIGLGGMLITFLGRMIRQGRRSAAG